MRIGSSELQKSAKSAQKAQKGSGGGGNRLAVRREMLRDMRGMRDKGVRTGDRKLSATPENVRDMRDKRGKGPVGVECAPCALIPLIWVYRSCGSGG